MPKRPGSLPEPRGTDRLIQRAAEEARERIREQQRQAIEQEAQRQQMAEGAKLLLEGNGGAYGRMGAERARLDRLTLEREAQALQRHQDAIREDQARRAAAERWERARQDQIRLDRELAERARQQDAALRQARQRR